MSPRNVLIAAVDGLRASALGAYGNASFATPAFDRFAAESFALDWCYALSADLTSTYRALWHSRHPLRPASAAEAGATLPDVFSAHDYRTILVTDEPELAALAAASEFDERVEIASTETANAHAALADDVAETALARLFAAACDVIESNESADSERSARLVWVHTRGMYGPWDAPLELQETLRDENDPPSIGEVTPPDLFLADDHDPDVVFQYSAAYAAQVMALDACWNGLVQAVDNAGAKDWLVVLMGVRGFPLGEHRRIGGVDARLFAEQLHVPALVRWPSGLGRLARSGGLASHLDLLPTLADWCEAQSQNTVTCDGMSWLPLAKSVRPAWRDSLVFGMPEGGRAIRTPEWCMRRDAALNAADDQQNAPEIRCELFVRPDDRWEANDVAKLCPDTVDALTHTIDDAERQLAC